MEFLDDLRDPGTPVGRIFYSLVLLLALSLLAVVMISGFVVRGVLWPQAASGGVDPDSLINAPDVFSFTVPGHKPYDAWLFPGLRTAPVVILCHGYRSQRSDLLTMIVPLQEHQYNVVVFDFSGHGANDGATTLGPGEAATLLTLIEELSLRNDLDGKRVGVWGADIGGYAALAAAGKDARIKAVAVDSVYDEPRLFLDMQVERTGVSAVPLVSRLTRLGYALFNWSTRNDPPLSARVAAMNQTAKFFIQGRDQPILADQTLQLFVKSPEPRQQTVLQHTGYPTLSNDEKQDYDNQVLNFFLHHLPITSPPLPAQ